MPSPLTGLNKLLSLRAFCSLFPLPASLAEIIPRNADIQTKEIEAQISSGKTSLDLVSWWGGGQSSHHKSSLVVRLSGWLVLVSCAGAGVYETAANLVR